MGWRSSEWPLPQQAAHGSVQTSPRPPQPRHNPRIGSSSGTIVPRRASRFDRRTSRVTVPLSRPSSPRKGVARAIDEPADRRKVDRDLVLEAVLSSPRRSAHCRERQRSARHEMDRVARSSHVNDRSGSHACQDSVPVLPSSTAIETTWD
jgi:hypothetical protein